MICRGKWMVAVMAVVLGTTGRAGAQDTNQLDISLQPRYGSANLKAGFRPDPHVVKVQAGGNLKVVEGGVTSHVARNPDFKLNYTARNGLPLTFFLESKGDTTLLINLPNGKWIANDDSGKGFNALIKLENPLSGRYDIYVGTFSAMAGIPAKLEITELPVRTNGQKTAKEKDFFTDQGDGTFKDSRSGLVWLKNPTRIPKAKSMADAKAIVANLKSGDFGLSDNSSAGDWRLPTMAEWSSTTDSTKKYCPLFRIGWTGGIYSKGYVSVSPQHPDGLTRWGPDNGADGGFDSTSWSSQVQGYVWPVRDNVRRPAAQDTTQLDISLKPRYGSVNLKAGFVPDPHVVNVQAGGTLKVVQGGVTSHVEKNPDFKLFYTAQQGVALTFSVRSKGDTTLLINLPNGTWVANDDGSKGLDAEIKLANPQSGRYDVYVGTFGLAAIAARLEITELK